MGMEQGLISDVTKSCIDLTIVSATITVKCQWEILDQMSVVTKQQRWKFEKADWGKFNNICKIELMSYSMESL